MQWLQNQWRRTRDATGAQPLSSEAQSRQTADSFLRAKDLLERGKVDQAFSILNRLKASGSRSENLDFLRAECFRRLGQPISAIESLKEELRYFPNNPAAATLLSELSAQYDSSAKRLLKDAEFLELYEAIRPYTMVGEDRKSVV